MNDLDTIRSVLHEMADLMDDGRDTFASVVRAASGGSDRDLGKFLVSGTLWGGLGSICDSGLYLDKPRRMALEKLLTRLANLQILIGKTAPRTRQFADEGTKRTTR